MLSAIPYGADRYYVFQGYEVYGGAVAESLFAQGLCLPSGTALTEAQLDYIVSVIREMYPVRRSKAAHSGVPTHPVMNPNPVSATSSI
jgi:hypothetical protein